jgi:hypothetical protein
MSTLVIETVTIRPELIEFEKQSVADNNIPLFLTIVGDANRGFVFADTANVSTKDQTDMSNIVELASVVMGTLTTTNLIVDHVSNVDTLVMDEGGAGVIDMQGGNVVEAGYIMMKDGLQVFGNTIDMDFGDITRLEGIQFENSSGTGIVMEWKSITDAHLIQFDVNVGELDMNSGNIDNVNVLKMLPTGVINMQGGDIVDLHHLTLGNDPGSFLDMNNGNILDTAYATIDNVISINVNATNISTGNITLDTIYGHGTVTINANVDDSTGASGIINVSQNRITNVGTPVEQSDAVNRSWLEKQLHSKLEGLAPKRAVQYSTTKNDVSGTETSKAYYLKPANDGTFDRQNFFIDYDSSSSTDLATGKVTITGTLDFFYVDTSSTNSSTISADVYFDGTILDEAAVAASSYEEDNFVRVLIKDLDTAKFEASIVEANVADNLENNTGIPEAYLTHMASRPVWGNISGLNGIWTVESVESHVTNNTTPWIGVNQFLKRVRMKRSIDMDESLEMMNNTYVYVTAPYSSVKSTQTPPVNYNFGWVIENTDPVSILTTHQPYGITVDGDGAVDNLNWVVFNEVNYELDFVQIGSGEGILNPDEPAFHSGAIMMRSKNNDEKEVMVDAGLFRFTQDVGGDGLLFVKGNVEFEGHASISNRNFDDGVIIEGSKFTAGGNINTTTIHATEVFCESDRTLKKNINTITNSVDLIDRLRGVTFNWNWDEESELPEYGLIAQEIEAVMPKLVRLNVEKQIKTVEYAKLVSVLIEGIKELKLEIEEIKKKMT